MNKIGVLHPGEMGVSVAATAINSGHKVYWVSEGRSEKTRERAEKYGLMSVPSLSALCETCEIILSVCPPHAAQDVALSVINASFKGFYLDANAIAPKRSLLIGQLMEAAGIRFVDGGIVGGPAWTPNETWLYLSGEHAERIAACFSNGLLETKIIGNEIGKASALKMCYAAYSKGTTALLATVLATAESLGVREDLYEQWDRDDRGFSDQVNKRVARVTAKAWRFEGEMKEIAATFQEEGLPAEFHSAAGEVYRRMSKFLSNHGSVDALENLLRAIIDKRT
jgi:3-hydroxyisobutyrate dehydrogenase-like beta-hydroxyacid dehydrogenase